MTPARILVALAALGAACARHAGPAAPVGAAALRPAHHPAAEAALQQAAADLDPAVRARALALLVRFSDAPGGGDWTPRGLGDPSPWVRRATLEALASRGEEAAALRHLAELAALTGADSYLRCAAGLRLAQGGHTGSLAAIQAAEAAESESWRAAPCALAAAALGDPGAEARLATMLAEGDLPLDIAFIDDVGRSGLTGLIPGLEEAADLVEEPLRPAIGAALMRLGASRGEAILREGLDAPMAEAQLESLDYLAALSIPAAEALLKKAAGAARPEVRTYARLILLARGEGSLATAEEAAISDNRELRAMALRLLGAALSDTGQGADRKATRTAQKLLEAGLQDPDDPVREAAAEGLAALASPVGTPALEATLADDNARVRVEAAGALLAIAAAR